MGLKHLPLLWWKCTKMYTFTRCINIIQKKMYKIIKAKDTGMLHEDWNGETILQMSPDSALLRVSQVANSFSVAVVFTV